MKQDEKKDDKVRFYYVNVTSEMQLLKTVRLSPVTLLL